MYIAILKRQWHVSTNEHKYHFYKLSGALQWIARCRNAADQKTRTGTQYTKQHSNFVLNHICVFWSAKMRAV